MKRYKIIAITQIHNELRKGHLERFFQYLPKIVDAIVVYDDASSDGSWGYAQKFTPHVIRGNKNDFVNERQHKKIMLDKALELKADFILWIDADEVVSDCDGSKLQELAAWVVEKDLDGAKMREINLWRSTNWVRTDNDFDSGDFIRFWRVKPGIAYTETKVGLHQSPVPDTVQKVKDQNLVSMLHFGFATDKSIIAKYLIYAKHGQKGQGLARLIDESELKLRSVDPNLFPPGLYREDAQPEPRPLEEWLKLADKFKAELLRPSISIVALIYKSTDWLKFCYEQVLKYTDMGDKEFFFVANDASEDVKEYLKENYIPHYLFENTPEHKQEWYINNVYRAWNYGGFKAKGDYILFINSDMAFTPGWVENIFARLNGKNCVCSRLVESGKLSSGEKSIEKNFGKLIEEYREAEFQEFAESASEEKIIDGGVFMPLLIKRDDFVAVGGYPEGNVVLGSDLYNPQIAQKGQEVVSGDVILMQKLKQHGVTHQTAFDSLSYHFQEGEMTSPADNLPEKEKTEIVVIERPLPEVFQNKTFWDISQKIPHTAVFSPERGKANKENADSDIASAFPNAKIILQDAALDDLVAPTFFTITCLLDNLRAKGKMSIQLETNLEKANILVTDSFTVAADYPEFYFRVADAGSDILSITKFWWDLIAEIKIRNHNFKSQSAIITSGKGKAWKKKIKMTLSNKNYLNVYFKKKLPRPVYAAALKAWRTMKAAGRVFK